MLFTQISKKISENKTRDISINLGYLEIAPQISVDISLDIFVYLKNT